MTGLFASIEGTERLGEGIVLWRAAIDEARYAATIARLALEAPFRHMLTPGGRQMSVAITNCGSMGWVSDTHGYRYSATDPDSSMPWPAIPPDWLHDASHAAFRCGFSGFTPDACLINRYEIGNRMGSHQDRNEVDFTQPVVSMSIGLPAEFTFHGASRAGTAGRVDLHSGDILVWGGPARLYFHSVRPIRAGVHPLCGALRYNLTFRRAGP